MLDYQSQKVTLDDIVFESRNKAYGAYVLRKDHSKTAWRAALIAVVVLLLAIIGPKVIKELMPAPEVEEEIVVDVTKLAPPPPLDPKTPPPPPPPPASSAPPPPKVSTVRLVPPEVARDEEVKEDPPKNEELQNKVTSNQTVEGDPNADPTEIVVDGTPGGTGTVAAPVEEEPFTVVEEMPTFPGGEGAMMSFFNKNIKYPAQALRSEKQGKVYLSFVVKPDGSIHDITVVRGIGFGLDDEALRVARMMPNWKPGKQGGRSVPVKCVIPIDFKISG